MNTNVKNCRFSSPFPWQPRFSEFSSFFVYFKAKTCQYLNRSNYTHIIVTKITENSYDSYIFGLSWKLHEKLLWLTWLHTGHEFIPTEMDFYKPKIHNIQNEFQKNFFYHFFYFSPLLNI